MNSKLQKYEAHIIANAYPMHTKKEFNNLVADMEQRGYDPLHPILIFEDKILDGRNRYKASLEAEVKPIFEIFEGNFEEAVEKSRSCNVNRRHHTPSQKAMIAAKEIQLTRDTDGMKNLSVEKAAIIHAISKTYIKLSLKILKKDENIAQSVFHGTMSLKEAQSRIEQIVALRESPSEDTDFGTDEPENTQSDQQSLLKEEFKSNPEATIERMVDLQDNFKTQALQIKELKEKLKECIKSKQAS